MVVSNRRNRIEKQPVSKRWRPDARRYFKRRRRKRRSRLMKKRRRQRKIPNDERRSVRRTQENVRLSGQTRRLFSRHLTRTALMRDML